MERTTVLFAHYGDERIRGSEAVLLSLLDELDSSRFRPVVWCNAAALAEECRRREVVTYVDEFDFYVPGYPRRFRPALFARLLWRAIRLLRKERVAVVHINNGAPGQWLIPASAMCRVPALVHLHTYYFKRSRLALGLVLAKRLVGCSRYVLSAFGPPEQLDRGVVIHNGVQDVARDVSEPACTREEIGIPETADVLVTVGALVGWKRIDVLIESLLCLSRRSERNPLLLVVGDGPERERLEALAQSTGANVRFLGWRTDVGSVLRLADVYVHAAEFEAFGLAIAEAGAAGLPRVAVARGGVGEIIEDGIDGRLVPTTDPAAIAEAVDELLKSRDRASEMGLAARKAYEERFTTTAMVRSFEREYEALASQR